MSSLNTLHDLIEAYKDAHLDWQMAKQDKAEWLPTAKKERKRAKKKLLQFARSNLFYFPARITADYYDGVAGYGPLAETWADKPHRLVYDLCGVVESLREQLYTEITPKEEAK